MDISSIIITAIFIAVCTIPFVLIGRKNKKRKKEKLQSLINIANKQNATISKSEVLSDYVIGMDEVKKQVFFFKKMKDSVIEDYINLAEIKTSKVKNTGRAIAYNNSNQSIIEKLELVFIPLDKNRKEIAWEFFNSDDSSQLGGELQSAEEWSNRINESLRN